jgi:hypothetical protein
MAFLPTITCRTPKGQTSLLTVVLKPLPCFLSLRRQISGNGLSGSLPPSFTSLGELREIWALNNALTGTIPKEFSRMQKLETFLLAQNSLTGELPRQFSNLSNMKFM